PGLLESAYEACLAYELQKLRLHVERQRPVPLVYEAVKLDCGFSAALVVENRLVVECKCKEVLHPVDEAQLLSHLRLLDIPVGLLINFHVVLLKDGIRRMVNNYREPGVEPLTARVAKEGREGRKEQQSGSSSRSLRISLATFAVKGFLSFPKTACSA